MAIFSYTNRLGVAYYLHETWTKAGVRRVIVKPVAEGALAELPDGMEIAENIHGQVSVRAARARIILPMEEALVQQALVKHGREKYRAEVKDKDIVIYEPRSNIDDSMAMYDRFNGTGFGAAIDKAMRERVGDAAWEEYLRMMEEEHRQKREKVQQEFEQRMQYSPVLRFRLRDDKRRHYTVDRMSYRGVGGWKDINSGLTLAVACDRYVPLLGTDKLFETYYD